jgi:hypothetical protein
VTPRKRAKGERQIVFQDLVRTKRRQSLIRISMEIRTLGNHASRK